LGKIACGDPITADENLTGYRYESPDNLPSGNLFYLQAKGDSMEPTIPNGSYVLIREQPEVENGEIAAVLVNGDTEATLKRVKRQAETVFLMPDNPRHEKHINYTESKLLSGYLMESLTIDNRPVYYIILLALKSGMRFAEIIALTRKDFNFKDNTININKTWGYTSSYDEGKKKTKKKSSNRIIKIDKVTMSLFNHFFEVTPENIHKLVFYNPASKYKVFSNTGVNKAF